MWFWMIYCRHPSSPLRTIRSVATSVALPLHSEAIRLFLLPSAYARTARFRNSLQVIMPQYAPYIRFRCSASRLYVNHSTFCWYDVVVVCCCFSSVFIVCDRVTRETSETWNRSVQALLLFCVCGGVVGGWGGGGEAGVCHQQFEGGFEPDTCWSWARWSFSKLQVILQSLSSETTPMAPTTGAPQTTTAISTVPTTAISTVPTTAISTVPTTAISTVPTTQQTTQPTTTATEATSAPEPTTAETTTPGPCKWFDMFL